MSKVDKFRGLFRHNLSGRLYFAEGLAMKAGNPAEKVVVYCQKYEDLDGSDFKYPVGTMWMRSPAEFWTQFQRVDEPLKLQRIMNSVTTALEKDIAFGYNKE